MTMVGKPGSRRVPWRTGKNRSPRALDAAPPLRAPKHTGGSPWFVRSRALIGMGILAPFAYLALATPAMAVPGSLAAMVWQTAAWCLFLTGTAFRFWATIYIGNSKGSRVVSDGPYSICRNPLYFGTFLITLSVAAFYESPIFAVGVALASCVYLATTVRWEEKNLNARLGKEYVQYCQRVPRFLPRLSLLHSPPTIAVDVRCLKIEAIRALRWAPIPLIVHLISYFQYPH
ncbi:MAG: isoprenylcysteine carboxylmethyltransferase family protein [Rhodopirellula sp.]|nr:isoprenylcysteine carboxylmethyltransferase family protein [Rhodopirellula sp.]